MANRNITISVTEENYESLLEEQNKSGLINHLLLKYYKERLHPEKKNYLTIEDIKKEKEKLYNNEEDYVKAIEMLTIQEQDILKRAEESKKSVDEKQKRALETFATYIEHLFVVSKEEAIKLAEQYYFVREEIDLYDWCESKKLVNRKE